MQKYIAELIGSFFLVLAFGLTGNTLGSGLLIVAIIYLGGHISGAHYNPAVTLSFWAARAMSLKTFLWYLLNQLTGALLGCILVFFMAGTALQVIPSSAASPIQYTSVELLFGFLLCMVYLTLFLVPFFSNNKIYGLVIGITYTGILMVGQPVTGGLFNPTLAAAISIVDFFDRGESYMYLHVYILSPAIGAIIAGNLFNFFVRNNNAPLSGEE